MRLFEGTEFDIPPRCDRCGKLVEECDCGPVPPKPKPPAKQTARIRLEKRKRGKQVTVIQGLDPVGDHLKHVLTQLKNACGAGGTVQDEQVELQGNHVERVVQLMSEMGYKTKV